MKQLVKQLGDQKKKLDVPVMATGFKCKDYELMGERVFRLVKTVQEKCKSFGNDDAMLKFNVFECLAHHHLVEMVWKPYKQTLHVVDIYRLLMYDKSTLLDRCVRDHYDTLSKIDKIMQEFSEETPTGVPNGQLSFRTKDCLHLKDHDEDVSIDLVSEFDYFAENENQAVCVYVSPQLNAMNYQELLSKMVVQHFFMKRSRKESVHSYILTLDYDKPILVNFENVKSEELIDFVKQYLRGYYRNYNDTFFEVSDEYKMSFNDLENVIKLNQLKLNQPKLNQPKLNQPKQKSPFPHYIRQYFTARDKKKGKCVPDKECDLNELNDIIDEIITDMFEN
jgi:hypothetical protein